MMFKLDLKNKYAYRIQNPGAERVNAKSQYVHFFLHHNSWLQPD